MSEHLVRKEREHVAALQARLDFLVGREGGSAQPPGEVNALAWVLNVVEEAALKVRVERVEKQLRIHSQRISEVEKLLAEEDDDVPAPV